MLTDESVNTIIAKVVEKIKTAKAKTSKDGVTNEDIYCLNFYDGYSEARDNMHAIKVHSEKPETGKFPAKLFTAPAPNMTENEFNFIRTNYKQVTQPVYLDMQSMIQRIFHDSNWSIQYPEIKNYTETDTYEQYVTKQIKYYGSVENYMKYILPHIKMTDSEGIVVIKPVDYEELVEPTGEDVRAAEEAGGDDSKLLNPIPFYYSCEQILAYEPDEYALVLLPDKSTVSYGSKKMNKGIVMELIDEDAIWRITQTGKYTDFEFKIEVLIKHALGYAPFIKLMGVPTIKSNRIFFLSQFLFVTDMLDIVAVYSNYLRASVTKCMFPYMIMYGNPCDFSDSTGDSIVNCDNGWLVYGPSKKMICPGCSGTGIKSRITRTGTMLIKPKSSMDAGDEGLSQEPLKYVEPPTNALEFTQKIIDIYEQKAKYMLHQRTTGNRVSVNPKDGTATAVIDDRKAADAFIKPISDQLFSITEFIYNTIGDMRYGEAFEGVQLSYAKTFDFWTEQDYLDEISQITAAGLPPFVVHQVIYQYLKSIYFTDEQTSAALQLIIDTDRILTLPQDIIALKLASGVVEKWEIVLHDSAITFIKELTEENKEFLKQDMPDKQKSLIEKAKAKADAIKLASPEQNTINNILSQTTPVLPQGVPA